jgi:hypothetical protein
MLHVGDIACCALYAVIQRKIRKEVKLGFSPNYQGKIQHFITLHGLLKKIGEKIKKILTITDKALPAPTQFRPVLVEMERFPCNELTPFYRRVTKKATTEISRADQHEYTFIMIQCLESIMRTDI